MKNTKIIEINNFIEEIFQIVKHELNYKKLFIYSILFIISLSILYTFKNINNYVNYTFINFIIFIFIYIFIFTFLKIIENLKFKNKYKNIFGIAKTYHNIIFIYKKNIRTFSKKNNINEKLLYDFIYYHEKKHILQYLEDKNRFFDKNEEINLEKEADEYSIKYLINNLNYKEKEIIKLKEKNLFY